MDNLGIKSPPIVIRPVATTVPAAPVVIRHEAPVLPIGYAADTEAYDPQVAEQQRFQAIQRVAQEVSDIFVVSDRTFTIFKDVSGQYITRFTSLRDGKVTYIPEPNLFKLGGENEGAGVRIRV